MPKNNNTMSCAQTNKQQQRQQKHDNCLFSMKRCTASLFLLTSIMICGGLAQDRNATTGALSLPNPKVIDKN